MVDKSLLYDCVVFSYDLVFLVFFSCCLSGVGSTCRCSWFIASCRVSSDDCLLYGVAVGGCCLFLQDCRLSLVGL